MYVDWTAKSPPKYGNHQGYRLAGLQIRPAACRAQPVIGMAPTPDTAGVAEGRSRAIDFSLLLTRGSATLWVARLLPRPATGSRASDQAIRCPRHGPAPNRSRGYGTAGTVWNGAVHCCGNAEGVSSIGPPFPVSCSAPSKGVTITRPHYARLSPFCLRCVKVTTRSRPKSAKV